jgi:hypothetical protein
MTLDPNAAAQATTDPSAPAPQATQAPTPAPAQASPDTTAQPPAAQGQPQGQATTPSAAVPQAAPDAEQGKSAGSIVKGILFGALSGAAKVGKAVGRTLENDTAVGQNIRARQTENQGEKQTQQIQQKQEDRAATEFDQKTQDWQILHNNLAMGAIHTAFMNSADESKVSAATNEANSAFMATLVASGLPMEDVKKFEQMGPEDAAGITKGAKTPVSGPTKGPEAGLHLLNTADLKGIASTVPMTIPTNYEIDPKTGELKATQQTVLPAGTDLYTGWLLHQSEMNKAQVKEAQYEANQKNVKAQADLQKTQGETAHEQAQAGAELTPAETALKTKSEASKAFAEAAKAAAEAKQAGAGITDANRLLKGEEFINTLPGGMQDGVRGLLRYQVAPTDLGRGKEKMPIVEAAIHADPTWSVTKYAERANYIKEYGSSTKGDGATRHRLTTAIGHMDMLASASDALAGNDVRKLNEIANELGVQTGKSPAVVYDAIASKAAGETAGAIKGGGAAATDPEIENARKSFDRNLAPQVRKDNMRAQFGILKTQADTIGGAFQSTMGKSPDEFGQPVLLGTAQQTLDKWLKPATGNVPSGQIRVQIPGSPAGFIPQAAVDQFKKDHPNAVVSQ